MAIQYYKLADGRSFSLDKATGQVQQVSSVPAGAPVVTWGGTGLPPDLQGKVSDAAPAQPVVATPQAPAPVQQPQAPTAATPPPTVTPQYQAPSQGTKLNLDTSTFTRSLGQGMNGDDVKKLQTALIAAGYQIPDGATGYYGPQTQAAVSAWQKAAGFDTEGGAGNFGPRSVAYLNGAANAPATPTAPTNSSNVPETPTTPQPNNENLRALGLSDATIASLSSSQKTFLESVGEAIKYQYSLGKTVPPTFTGEDLDRIFKEAQNAPDINDYYKENLRIGGEELGRSMAFLSGDYSLLKRQQEDQFAQEEKDLAEAEAAAGRAYSGFRGQAEAALSDTQAGIIESTKRTLAKTLESKGSEFEKKFGTDALVARGGISLDGETYNPLGGIEGTEAANKLVDIRNRESELRATEALNRGDGGPAAPVVGTGTTAPGAPASSTTVPNQTPTPTQPTVPSTPGAVPYTFVVNPSGLVERYKNGQREATGTAESMRSFGYTA